LLLLHGGCFYGLLYEELEHRPLTEKAKHYAEPAARGALTAVTPTPLPIFVIFLVIVMHGPFEKR
jgi:hypothetical protein